MLAETKPDLVVIATPNYAHYSPAILALNAGCHTFIETPFTLSSSQGQHLRRLAEEKANSFCGSFGTYVTWHVESQSGFRTKGKLGRITVARAMRQRWIENLPNKEWWKLDANLTGGELFHLIHELDLLCWLLGDIEAVFAQAANQAHHDTPDSRDVLQLLLRFKNGVLGLARNGHGLSITPMGHSNSW